MREEASTVAPPFADFCRRLWWMDLRSRWDIDGDEHEEVAVSWSFSSSLSSLSLSKAAAWTKLASVTGWRCGLAVLLGALKPSLSMKHGSGSSTALIAFAFLFGHCLAVWPF